MRGLKILSLASTLALAFGCDIAVPGLDGPTCLDDFLADVGKDRKMIEEEAAATGLDAATILETLAMTEGITDAVIDCEATADLDSFAGRTGGDTQTSASGDDAAGALVDQAGQEPVGSEMILLLDATGSMQDDLDAVRDRMPEILGAAGKRGRAGLVLYRDKNVDVDWYSVEAPLAPKDDPAFDAALSGVIAEGGGDFPESLYDAVTRVLETQRWQGDDRSILVLTDAAPLEDAPTTTTATEDSTVAMANDLDVVVSVVQVELW